MITQVEFWIVVTVVFLITVTAIVIQAYWF